LNDKSVAEFIAPLPPEDQAELERARALLESPGLAGKVATKPPLAGAYPDHMGVGIRDLKTHPSDHRDAVARGAVIRGGLGLAIVGV